MNRQAWRDFFITVFLLGLAFVLALLSSVAADQHSTQLAAIAAAISLLLALIGALYIIPRLARNVRLEFLRFAIRTSVTLEGLLFIVFLVIIGFAAWNNGNNLLYLVLSAMIAFLIAANLIARISLADMSIQLRFPDHIFAGEPANISVTLLNHKRFMPSYSLLIEALAEDGERDADLPKPSREASLDNRVAASPRPRISPTPRPRITASKLELGKLAYFVLVPARSSARQRIEHTFERRGRYPITGFRIATKFPAGFFKKWRRIDAAGEILVYPKPQPLDDFYHGLPMLAGQIQSQVRGMGDDLYAIRRYHPSDHMRNIDWKATAKTMEIMVREHMREDEWRLTIVFDTASPDSKSRGAAFSTKSKSETRSQETDEDGIRRDRDLFRERFEQAVLMAASLANHFILERAEVELIATGDYHNVPSGAGLEHLYKILGSLATLEPIEFGSLDTRASQSSARPPWTFLRKSKRAADTTAPYDQADERAGSNFASALRLLEDVPVLRDDRRFKVLITSAQKGTIPAHIWRSAHVVFMDDL